MIDDSHLPAKLRKNWGYSKWVIDSWRACLDSVGYNKEKHQTFIDGRNNHLLLINDSSLNTKQKIELITKRK